MQRVPSSEENSRNKSLEDCPPSVAVAERADRAKPCAEVRGFSQPENC